MYTVRDILDNRLLTTESTQYNRYKNTRSSKGVYILLHPVLLSLSSVNILREEKAEVLQLLCVLLLCVCSGEDMLSKFKGLCVQNSHLYAYEQQQILSRFKVHLHGN